MDGREGGRDRDSKWMRGREGETGTVSGWEGEREGGRERPGQ